MIAASTQPAMSPAEARGYRAGVEAVRHFAKIRHEDHQARVRARPNHRWTVTIGFLGALGGVVEYCDTLLAEQTREGNR